MATLKKQAFLLTLANAYTRALGFMLRLFTARLMGAQALGVMEMAASVVMLAITPVTAGIPTAVSRLAAQKNMDAHAVLHAGLSLVKRLSFLLIPCMFLLSPALSWLLGDFRTLPAIIVSLPCILLLGQCAVYSGYFYGMYDAATPALNECVEQTVRCSAAILLLFFWGGRNVAITAALPNLAEVAAGCCVLLLFRRKTSRCHRPANPALRKDIIRLTAPTTGARLCQTALRSLNAILLPVCLQRSGLSADAATAQFGLLNGMAMPLLMLPGIVTGAICMVATPAASRQESSPARLQRTMRQLLLSASAIGLLAALLLFIGAELFSTALYHEPALAPLLRAMAPSALLMALQQVQFGLITGLGLQNKALTGTVFASFLSLGLTALLCPQPLFRLYGAAIATMAGTLLRVCWNAAVLHRRKGSEAGVLCRRP